MEINFYECLNFFSFFNQSLLLTFRSICQILFLEPHFHFEPSHTQVAALVEVEFTSDQLLIRSDLKWYHSATKVLDSIIILPSHFNKSFFSRVEVNLDDILFILSYDHFYFSNLFQRVKCVSLIGCEWSSLALLTIS